MFARERETAREDEKDAKTASVKQTTDIMFVSLCVTSTAGQQQRDSLLSSSFRINTSVTLEMSERRGLRAEMFQLGQTGWRNVKYLTNLH